MSPGSLRPIAVILVDGLYDHTPGILLRHLRGIERGAEERGLSVMVLRATGESLPKMVRQVNAAGLILMGSQSSDQVLREAQRTPSIWVGSHRDLSGDTVIAGNYRLGQLAAKYLLDRGHRHVAFLSVMSRYPAYPARAESFAFAAGRKGAKVDTFLDERPTRIAGDAGETSVIAEAMDGLIAQMLASPSVPTGLFIPNDMMTATAYASLRRRGVNIGEDVDIISCNNEEAYLMGLHPRPATIDIGAEVMGRRSVELLLLRMTHPHDNHEVQLAVEPRVIDAEMGWSPCAIEPG